jgi:hypothetical protein
MSGKRELMRLSRSLLAIVCAQRRSALARQCVRSGQFQTNVRASLTTAPGQASRQAREKVSYPVFGLALVRPPADPCASVRYAGFEKDQVGMIDSSRAIHGLRTARESPPTTSEPYFFSFVSRKKVMKQMKKNTSLRARVLGFFRRRQRRLAAECELRAWWRDSGLWCVALGVPLSAAELARVLRLYRRCGREVRRAFGTDWRVRKLLLRSASVAAVRRSRVRRVRAWRQRRWFRRLWRRLRRRLSRAKQRGTGRALPSQTLPTMLAQVR